MKNILLFLLLMFALNAFSQHAKEFMISGHADIIKSDNDGLFKKAQTSFEMNYFITRRFSAGGGHEITIGGRDPFLGMSLTIGGRFYLIPNLFFRLRAIDTNLLKNIDFVEGVGWSKPFKKRWKVEMIGDYYHDTKDFAFRGGLGYVINPRE